MREKIIQVAEKLLKERGYHGWSYADIAEVVDIKKASIHYHFAKKEDLGLELIRYFTKNTENAVNSINQSFSPLEKFYALADLYGQVLKQGNAFCLCGMLTADFLTLPPLMKDELKVFFNSQKIWIRKVLEEGVQKQHWRCADSAQESALIMSCLQGMLLISRLEPEPYVVYSTLAKKFFSEKYG
jgi:TetR/AcrR family transcriptional repressor of nem operon